MICTKATGLFSEFSGSLFRYDMFVDMVVDFGKSATQ